MKQSKTKKALAMSMLSMVLCIAMLVGMTFAWFTDTASTSVNKIQAGTLDVALEMWDATAETKNDDGTTTKGAWVSAEGKTLDFVKSANAPENEAILWEPGAKYDLPKIQIKNNGNLALKYKVIFSAVGGDTELAEVLDVYMNGQPVKVNGKQATLKDVLTSTDPDGFAHGNLLAEATSGEITISMHMQETAGNGYQGLAINGVAITVLATQDTVEYDSYGNQYDKNAGYMAYIDNNTVANANWYDPNADTLTIESGEDFVAFMETAYTWGVANKPSVPDFAGKTVELKTDIVFAEGYVWTPISPYDSMYLGNGGFKGTFDGNGHTIYNMNSTHENKTGRGYRIGLFGEVGDGAVFKNFTMDGANTYAGNTSAGAVCALTSGNVSFENITIRNATIRQGRCAGGIVGDIRKGTTGTVKFENCTVENSAIFNIHSNYCGALYGVKDSDATVVIDNCKIDNVVKHFFKDSEGKQDWDTFHYITLADALERYKAESATYGGN